jgi:hypothetical protein
MVVYASANEMDAVVRKTEIQKQETPKPMPDDPIPNNDAAEFHPSHNWKAWVGLEKLKINEFSSSGDTTSWFQQNKEYLKQLKKYNETMHRDIEKAWSEQNERMNT